MRKIPPEARINTALYALWLACAACGIFLGDAVYPHPILWGLGGITGLMIGFIVTWAVDRVVTPGWMSPAEVAAKVAAYDASQD